MNRKPTICLTTHAIERYNQRARNGNCPNPEHEAKKLIAFGFFTHNKPYWVHPGSPTDAYMMIGKRIVFICSPRKSGRGFIATTCVVKGEDDYARAA